MRDCSEGKRIAKFSAAVRESTLKRLRLVPDGSENWRVSPDAMSFADTVQHLIDADEWLFKKFEIKNIDPIRGQSGLIHIENRNQYLALLERLKNIGQRRADMLEKLDESALAELIYDARFGADVAVWWIIVRGNIDHEIHHRGQIAAYLRMLKT
jgi:uncharacterized damage-inducible protein DinB